jgi:hypothetical protein
MTTTHIHQCLINAESLVTEELHLQGLWDATYVDGDDLRIPAWGMTVRAVRDMWLDEGTVTCRCDEASDVTSEQLEQDHAEALEEDVAHDAAANAAQDLTTELLCRYADRPVQLPRAMRYGAGLRIVVPQ